MDRYAGPFVTQSSLNRNAGVFDERADYVTLTEILIELQAPLDRNEVIDRYRIVRWDYEFFR